MTLNEMLQNQKMFEVPHLTRNEPKTLAGGFCVQVLQNRILGGDNKFEDGVEISIINGGQQLITAIIDVLFLFEGGKKVFSHF